VEAQRLDGPDDLFGRFVKVRDENTIRAAQELLKMVSGLAKSVRRAAPPARVAQQADQLPLRVEDYVRANFIVKTIRPAACAGSESPIDSDAAVKRHSPFYLRSGTKLHGIAGIEQQVSMLFVSPR